MHTVAGRYSPRGWTDWTQGFEFGSAILQFDATGEERFLDLGLARTRRDMPAHITHFGVHDHGFNQVSTYGNLLRLMAEGRIPPNEWQKEYFELALKCSAAVQARRWTDLGDGAGYIYSFNGPHSLFIDTMRTLRVLALGHQLGHVMKGEGDAVIPLLGRLVMHARTTATYNLFWGEGRDIWDERGRTAHEAIFNVANGAFRCVNAQQGYSGYSTWMRGLAWAMTGYAELLEFLDTLDEADARAPWRQGGDHRPLRPRHGATCGLLHRPHGDRRHPLLGHRRAGAEGPRRRLCPPVGAGQRHRAGRLVRRRRSAPRALIRYGRWRAGARHATAPAPTARPA